jgi:hypothetical protein
MSNGFRYVLAMSFGFLAFGLLISHAGKTDFGAINVQVATPRGPNAEERADMDAKMAKYRSPRALFNLIIYGQE